jgi:hypothetical protein
MALRRSSGSLLVMSSLGKWKGYKYYGPNRTAGEQKEKMMGGKRRK